MTDCIMRNISVYASRGFDQKVSGASRFDAAKGECQGLLWGSNGGVAGELLRYIANLYFAQ